MAHPGQAHRSSTPPANPAPPLSKRDKRRSALTDRLQDLTNSFSQNRDLQFRQQLHSLHHDLNLILNADIYGNGPLDDSAETIATQVDAVVAGGQYASEMRTLSGKWYSRFIQEVNQTKEEKDTELTMLMVCFFYLLPFLLQIFCFT
jgi:hypothetical protein